MFFNFFLPEFCFSNSKYSIFALEKCNVMNNSNLNVSLFTKSIFIIVGCLMLSQCSSREERKAVVFPTNVICEGDIAFRRGEGLTSELVIHADAQGTYSHVGVVVQSDSGLVVVHAVPGAHPSQVGADIVRAERLADFFAPDNAIRGEIVRYPLDSVQKRTLSRLALMKVEQGVEFDHEYDSADTVKLYCTELLQLTFSNIGINLSEGRATKINLPSLHREVIMPSDIYMNRKLITIFDF